VRTIESDLFDVRQRERSFPIYRVNFQLRDSAFPPMQDDAERRWGKEIGRGGDGKAGVGTAGSPGRGRQPGNGYGRPSGHGVRQRRSKDLSAVNGVSRQRSEKGTPLHLPFRSRKRPVSPGPTYTG
jgi:hypothetical protein